MCPHTWSRLSVPAAKRLKYSERRKGLRASSSAVSPSNHASGVMPSPPSPRATSVGSDYIRSGDSPWRSRDARRLRGEEEHLPEAQHLARPGLVEADQVTQGLDRRRRAEPGQIPVQVALELVEHHVGAEVRHLARGLDVGRIDDERAGVAELAEG